MQTTSNQSKTNKSPESTLQKGPFVRLNVIEAKDIFLLQGTRRETGDLYARINYGSEKAVKTK